MIRKLIIADLIGTKYGKLLIIGESKIKKHNRVSVDCVCECGEKIIATINALRKGNTKSCGCIRKESPYNY